MEHGVIAPDTGLYGIVNYQRLTIQSQPCGLALSRLLRIQKPIFVAMLNALDRPEINLTISIVVLSINIIISVTAPYIIDSLEIVVATIMSEVLAYAIGACYVGLIMPNLSLITQPVYNQLANDIVIVNIVYMTRQAPPIRF